jgi:hypothetical protein
MSLPDFKRARFAFWTRSACPDGSAELLALASCSRRKSPGRGHERPRKAREAASAGAHRRARGGAHLPPARGRRRGRHRGTRECLSSSQPRSRGPRTDAINTPRGSSLPRCVLHPSRDACYR